MIFPEIVLIITPLYLQRQSTHSKSQIPSKAGLHTVALIRSFFSSHAGLHSHRYCMPSISHHHLHYDCKMSKCLANFVSLLCCTNIPQSQVTTILMAVNITVAAVFQKKKNEFSFQGSLPFS